jgi:choline dehydrogenase
MRREREVSSGSEWMRDGLPSRTLIDGSEAIALEQRSRRRAFLATLVRLGVGAAGIDVFSDYLAAAELSQSKPLRDSYDYIIVGAGSAGCLLAERLSVTGATVLLVEAGGDRIKQPKIADVADWLQNLHTETDWNRLSDAQVELTNRPVAIPAGKIWGGSGSINAMIWLRGDPRDYQRWWKLVGREWSPTLLNNAYLKIVQSANVCDTRSARVSVGRYADNHPITAAYLSAGVGTGLPLIELNGGKPLDGVGVTEANVTAKGHRSGPAQAFLVPALVRSNFKILSDVLVTRLLLQGTVCRGVEVASGQTVRQIKASRETLICAGTYASPQLLMLSGIGPASQLAPLNIQVRQDMPAVGANLHDHVLMSVLFRTKGTIPMPVMNGVSTMAYYGGTPTTAPEMQVAGMQYPYGSDVVSAGNGYTLLPWLAKPRSRGKAMLASADPRLPLRLNPNYLREQIDRDNMLMGFDRAVEMGAGSAMRDFYGSLVIDVPVNTKSEKLAYISRQATCGVHGVGTCAASSDPRSGVVDGRFKVHGIDNLRVIDASVVPEVSAVNTHAPVLTIAQLAADQLINDARNY